MFKIENNTGKVRIIFSVKTITAFHDKLQIRTI